MLANGVRVRLAVDGVGIWRYHGCTCECAGGFMGERKTVKLTLMVAPGSVDVWRAAARELGFLTLAGGARKGGGNVSALFSAVAAGDVDPARLASALKRARAMVQEPIDDRLEP